MYVKTMHLCDASLRPCVNLVSYAWEIERCVLKVLPKALVEVGRTSFLVMTDYPQTHGEARKIGFLMGKTRLGKLTRHHYYRNRSDDSPARSGKIFIEVRNPKGLAIIDEAQEQAEIEAALAEMDENRTVHEPIPFADIPIEQLERDAPPACECVPEITQEPCQCA